MELVLVDKSNYKEAIKIQNSIFPKENGTLNILASLNRGLFIKLTGLNYEDDHVKYYLVPDCCKVTLSCTLALSYEQYKISK